MLLEVIDLKEAEPPSDDEEEEDARPSAVSASEGMSAFDALKAGVKREDGAVKAQDDAIDYSDITELSEDCPRTPPEETSTYDDLEDAIPASKVEAKLSK